MEHAHHERHTSYRAVRAGPAGSRRDCRCGTRDAVRSAARLAPMPTRSRTGRIEALLKFEGDFVRAGSRFGRFEPMAERMGAFLEAAVAKLRRVAPYALLIAVVPGGAVLAFLLWFHRRPQKSPASAIRRTPFYRGVRGGMPRACRTGRFQGVDERAGRHANSADSDAAAA